MARYDNVAPCMSRSLLLVAVLPFTTLVRAREVVVEYRTFQVAPDPLRIAKGTTVRWINRDQIEHTVTGGTPASRVPGWNGVLGGVGTAATRRFDRPGHYTYFCDRHQFMRGTVVVTP